MSNFQEFIENVKAGKVEGLSAMADALSIDQVCVNTPADNHNYFFDHLCAHIRRWLTGRGYEYILYTKYLLVCPDRDPDREFSEGSELDWHIDAANWVIKQGVEGC
jgi:hypothetical protein